MKNVTFLAQVAPVDEYGRALYAVSRSVLRALLDQLSKEDLTDINTSRPDVTLRQLAKLARLERDKGMRGDGFEWAVHEAIVGREPLVCNIISDALSRVSKNLAGSSPTSVLFGYERAKYLGFLDAVIKDAGVEAVLLPDGRGRPFAFGPWVALAAKGAAAEPALGNRIKKVWKTDLFLGTDQHVKYAAATVKSNWRLLEDGPGLRLGIVPEAKDLLPRTLRHKDLHLAVLPDPDGFMGLFDDAYRAIAGALCELGKQPLPPYYSKPSAKAQRVQQQLLGFGGAKVIEIEHELDLAAQQNLIEVQHQLVSVAAPPWLHISEQSIPVLAPKPSFVKLD